MHWKLIPTFSTRFCTQSHIYVGSQERVNVDREEVIEICESGEERKLSGNEGRAVVVFLQIKKAETHREKG